MKRRSSDGASVGDARASGTRREEENMQKVQCVPGGHQVDIDRAYWYQTCGHYLCYDHARSAMLISTIKCAKGHPVTKAK